MGFLDTTLSLVERAGRAANQWRHQRQITSRASNRPKTSVGESFFSRILASATGGWGWPGMWSRERLEFPQHFKHWTYVAVNAIMDDIRGREPEVAWVEHDGNSLNHGSKIHKAMRIRRYVKTNNTIKPHEKVTHVPPNHPLMRLFKRPNTWDTAGFSDILAQTIQFLCLSGEAFWWMIPDPHTGQISELWTVPSHWCWIQTGQNDILQVVVRPFPTSAGTLFIPWEQIVYFQLPSPLSKIGGWSPQRAISEWIDVGESIDQSRFWSMKNVLAPLGVIEMPEGNQDPSDDVLERYYEKFYARFQGEFNHGKPLLLSSGSKFTPLKIMPSECDFTGSFDQLRDSILATFRVPKQIAGLQDAGSQIAMWGPLTQFHEQCIKPKLQYIGAVVTTKVATLWDERLRVWWPNPVDSSPEQRRADREQQFKYGLLTDDEARVEFDNEPMSEEEKKLYSKLMKEQPPQPGGGGPGAPMAAAGPGAPSAIGSPVGPGAALPGMPPEPGGHPGGGGPGTPISSPSQPMPLKWLPPEAKPIRSWSQGVTLTLPERAKQLAEERKKRYGCLMLPIGEPLASKLKLLSDALPDEELADKGRQAGSDYHLTVLHGLIDDDVDVVRKTVLGVGPISFTLGSISIFPDTGDGEVVKVDVGGDDLHALHAYLADHLPHVQTQDRYAPHITLGYLRAGTAEKYVGPSGLEGESLAVRRVIFSNRDKVKHSLPLETKEQPAKAPESDSQPAQAPEQPVSIPEIIEKRLNGELPSSLPFAVTQPALPDGIQPANGQAHGEPGFPDGGSMERRDGESQ